MAFAILFMLPGNVVLTQDGNGDQSTGSPCFFLFALSGEA
jgi:hypothetical protein